MEILKFNLSGKTAFFKKPDVNTYYYFTYGNIHKVALLGIFGAILGYGGYAQMKKGDQWPNFYQRLENLHVAISPSYSTKGSFGKKIQSFNNSVGYASKEQGGNLIVKQQWLEDPSWDIYVLIDSDESRNLKESIVNHRNVYIPYLGSNNHPADIKNVEIKECSAINSEEYVQVDSLFYKKDMDVDYESEPEETSFVYEEYLPMGLQPMTNMYESEKCMFTNLYCRKYSNSIYNVEGKNIAFL